MEAQMLLREQEIYPSEEVLKNVLGQVYDVWVEFETQVTQGELALTIATGEVKKRT
jgi:hypothetical protein